MMKKLAPRFSAKNQELLFLSKFFLISNKAAIAPLHDENTVKDPLLERKLLSP
jgi:hypothetical protein